MVPSLNWEQMFDIRFLARDVGAAMRISSTTFAATIESSPLDLAKKNCGTSGSCYSPYAYKQSSLAVCHLEFAFTNPYEEVSKSQ